MVGIIPAIRRFIDSSSDMNVPFKRAQIGASGHVAHEQRLEDRPAEGEAQDVFEDHFGEDRRCRGRSTAPRPARMPTPSPATQCMVDPSVCRHCARDVALVRPGQRLAAAEARRGTRRPRRYRRSAARSPISSPAIPACCGCRPRRTAATAAASRNHSNITPSNIEFSLARPTGSPGAVHPSLQSTRVRTTEHTYLRYR